MIAKFRAFVAQGKIVLEVDGEPPRVVGRVVVCPCCGAKFLGGEVPWPS